MRDNKRWQRRETAHDEGTSTGTEAGRRDRRSGSGPRCGICHVLRYMSVNSGATASCGVLSRVYGTVSFLSRSTTVCARMRKTGKTTASGGSSADSDCIDAILVAPGEFTASAGYYLTIHRQHHSNGLTQVNQPVEKSENLIQWDFTATKPNKKVLIDITEIPCSDGGAGLLRRQHPGFPQG